MALDSAHLSDSVPLTSHQGHLVPWLMQDAWPLPQKAQVLATLELATQLWLLSQSHTPVPYALMLAPDGSQQQVYLNEALSAQVQNQVQHVQMLLSKDALPLPLANDFKCQQCPLAGICLPDETHLLRQALKPQPENEAESNMAHTSVFPPGQEDSEEQGPVKDPAIVRRFLPAREERLALYVQEHGAYISLDGEEFVIKRRNGEFVRARIAHTSHISCFGNVQYSTQMQRKTFDLGLPIFFFSQNGYYQGRTHTYESRQAPLRLAQYRLWNDEAASLEVAKAFVKGKVQNGRTLLRRNQQEDLSEALQELKRLSHALEGACSRNALMGVEGQAARTYFRAFATLVKDDACGTFDFQTRNRRPPRDPVNAMLSFGYALLMKEALVATLAVGLDSFLGIYHQPHTGRDSLALDLMEEFRPLIVDSTVLTLINTRALRAEHFQVHAHGCALTQTGRRTFIEAYERRMEQLISHPAFGYPISYRRVLEVQARLFSRYLLGELQHYQPFVTR